MNIVPRHVLRLVAIGAFATAIPQFASAAAGNGPSFSFAMGPMSAAQKNQGSAGATSDIPTMSTCPEGSCWKPHYRRHHHHYSKHKHAHSK